MNKVWPSDWQRAFVFGLALLNWWEFGMLYRQRPGLAAVNGVVGSLLAILSAVPYRRPLD